MIGVMEFDNDPTALYRLYDANGNLLYVGIAFNPKARMFDHARKQPWWGDVARKTLEWFPDRAAASRAEDEVMDAEHPRYNERRSTPSTPGEGRGVWITLPPDALSLCVERRLAEPWFGEVALHESYLETIWEDSEPPA